MTNAGDELQNKCVEQNVFDNNNFISVSDNFGNNNNIIVSKSAMRMRQFRSNVENKEKITEITDCIKKNIEKG
jgi:hypothetical protein